MRKKHEKVIDPTRCIHIRGKNIASSLLSLPCVPRDPLFFRDVVASR